MNNCQQHNEEDELLSLLEESESNVEAEETHGSQETEEDFQKRIKSERVKEMQLSNSLKAEELKSKEQDRQQRKEFADKIFSMLSLFLFFVCLILFFAGTKSVEVKPYPDFELSDNVLIALLTTASANVIGIFVVVVRYLFPSQTK